MKYVKFLSLPLAVFLAACSDPLPKCGDPEAVSLLKDLQKEDIEHFLEMVHEGIKETRRNASLYDSFDLHELLTNQASQWEKQIFSDLKRRGVVFGDAGQEKPVKYSTFTSTAKGDKKQIRQCSAVVDGEMKLTKTESAFFKNFSVSYDLQLTDDKKYFTLKLRSSLFPDFSELFE